MPLPARIVFTGRVAGVADGTLPSCPLLSAPQAHTEPSVPRIAANLKPARGAGDVHGADLGHPHRGGAAGQGAVAELPVVVAAPGPHRGAAAATTATAESKPAAIAVTRDTPVIWTGTALLAVLPLPSWPTLLTPQAHTVPSERSARLNAHPAAILTTPASPVTGAAVAS